MMIMIENRLESFDVFGWINFNARGCSAYLDLVTGFESIYILKTMISIRTWERHILVAALHLADNLEGTRGDFGFCRG